MDDRGGSRAPLVVGVVALLGFGWMVWLVASSGSFDIGSDTVHCFSVLAGPSNEPADAGTDPSDHDVSEDTESDGTGVNARCDRLRDRRLAAATLAGPAVAVLGSVALVSGGRAYGPAIEKHLFR